MTSLSDFPPDVQAAVATAFPVGGLDSRRVVVALAIMAERERCALYHDDMAAQHEAFRHDAKGELIEHHTKMARFHLASAAAIRSPQPSPTPGA